MKYTIFTLVLAFIITGIHQRAYTQIGNNEGRYNDVINNSFSILEDIKNANKKTLLSNFKYSGFQLKSEFKHFLSKKNLNWAKETLELYGMPVKEDVSISEWRTVSKDKENIGSTVNLTFFFKKKDEKFSIINDHISLNFKKDKDGNYYLDGMMFFKKNDYIEIKKIIEDLP